MSLKYNYGYILHLAKLYLFSTSSTTRGDYKSTYGFSLMQRKPNYGEAEWLFDIYMKYTYPKVWKIIIIFRWEIPGRLLNTVCKNLCCTIQHSSLTFLSTMSVGRKIQGKKPWHATSVCFLKTTTIFPPVHSTVLLIWKILLYRLLNPSAFEFQW